MTTAQHMSGGFTVQRVVFDQLQDKALRRYWWNDTHRIEIARNYGLQTYSALVDGHVIGARFYTPANAARAALRHRRRHPLTDDLE